jgi:Uma2 family endonuclease
MATVHFDSEIPLMVQFGPSWKVMSDDEFFEFCQSNRDVRIERAANGDIVIMPPAGADSSGMNALLNLELGIWNRIQNLGKVYDSSGGFTLRTGAVLSPDASWVLRDRVEQLSKEQRRKFLPLAPDFVAEIRSPSDSLTALHKKMREYIDAGVRLGWLIDPDSKTLWVYQPGSDPTQLDNPESISGDPVLPGFVLKLATIWG